MLFNLGTAESAERASTFNQLVLLKDKMERLFGLEEMECFPFLDNIGFAQDQRDRIENCLTGAGTLQAALEQVPAAGIRIVGISNRFIRTGGFHTVLVPWNASVEAMAGFFRQRRSEKERTRYLEIIYSLSRLASKKTGVREIYCAQRISNDQCRSALETLTGALAGRDPEKVNWREVKITDASAISKNPFVLLLRFDADGEEMLKAVFETNPGSNWSESSRVYDRIQKLYGNAFRTRLQLPNFFCATNLKPAECLQGAENLFHASADPVLQERLWGEVNVNRFNTLIRNDFDAEIRYDLPPEEIVRVFSAKSDRREVERQNVLAEALETNTRNNPTGLRVVCDPVDLRADLCAGAYTAFIEFVRANRNFKVWKPMTELMFVDGQQLFRVNFALNSKVRRHYIYVDAHSTLEELTEHLMNFAQ